MAVGMVTDGWEESATGNSWGWASGFGERETKGIPERERESERLKKSYLVHAVLYCVV